MIVKTAEAWCRLTEVLSPSFHTWGEKIKWQYTNFLAIEDFSSVTALCTAYSNLLIRGRFGVRPLPPGDLYALKAITAGLKAEDIERYVSDVMNNIPRSVVTTDERAILKDAVREALESLFRELGGLSESGIKDARFIKNVLLHLGQG
jgi:hypothetical protein